jgi:hypothetical protein
MSRRDMSSIGIEIAAELGAPRRLCATRAPDPGGNSGHRLTGAYALQPMAPASDGHYACCELQEAGMLSTLQKAAVLAKAGFRVPDCPMNPPALHYSVVDQAAGASSNERRTPAGQDPVAQNWSKAIETLYVAYAAARAAKSLRDAEEARQMDMLRRLAGKARA